MQIFCTAKVKVYQRTSYRPEKEGGVSWTHLGLQRFPLEWMDGGYLVMQRIGSCSCSSKHTNIFGACLLYPTSPETLLQPRVARVAQQKTNMEAKDVGVASWAKAHKIDFKKTIQELQCELTVRESTEMVLNEVNQSLPWMGGSCKNCWGDQHYGIRAQFA